MRYCPNCKKRVNTVLTAGQAILMFFLFPLLPFFLIYCLVHEKICPFCKSPTKPIDLNNIINFDTSTFQKFVSVKKIIKSGKFIGYEFNGLKSDMFDYQAFFSMDKKRAIEIRLDNRGCAKYYFDFEPNDDNTLLYYAEGSLLLRN